MNCLQLHQLISFLARCLVGDPNFPGGVSRDRGALDTLRLVPSHSHVKFDAVIFHLVQWVLIPLFCFCIQLNTAPGTCHPCCLPQAVSQC